MLKPKTTIDEMIKIKDIQLDINKNYYQLK